MSTFEVNSWISDKPFSMSQLHGHEFFELYFLIDGRKRYISQSSMYEIPKGCMVITKPHELHMFEGGPFNRMLIYVSPNMLAPHQLEFLNQLANETPLYTFPAKVITQINKLLFAMLADEKNKTPESTFRKHVTFDYLLYLISKYKISCEEKNEQKETAVMHPVVIKAVEYINEHYTEKISLNELCEKFHVSKIWLSKKFLFSMSTSITNYQILLKINKAKEKLVSTNSSLTTISNELGFSSPKYFALTFKKETGLSPSTYRKKMQNA